MRISGLSILLLITVFMSSQAVTAANHRGGHRYESVNQITLDNAVSRAKNQYKGRVISAETEKRNGKGTHKIRILTDDGRVRRLNVDQQSGEYVRPPRR